MTNEEAIKRAAEICGWEVHQCCSNESHGCMVEPASNDESVGDYVNKMVAGHANGALDALALQLWRKWIEEVQSSEKTWGPSEGREWMVGQLQDDSLRAIKAMLEAFEALSDIPDSV